MSKEGKKINQNVVFEAPEDEMPEKRRRSRDKNRNDRFGRTERRRNNERRPDDRKEHFVSSENSFEPREEKRNRRKNNDFEHRSVAPSENNNRRRKKELAVSIDEMLMEAREFGNKEKKEKKRSFDKSSSPFSPSQNLNKAKSRFSGGFNKKSKSKSKFGR